MLGVVGLFVALDWGRVAAVAGRAGAAARSPSAPWAWRSARSRARCAPRRCWRSCSRCRSPSSRSCPAASVAAGLYDVIRVVSALFPFKPALRGARRGAQRRRPRRWAGRWRTSPRSRSAYVAIARAGAADAFARDRPDAPRRRADGDPADRPRRRPHAARALRVANRAHTAPVGADARRDLLHRAPGSAGARPRPARLDARAARYAFAVLDASADDRDDRPHRAGQRRARRRGRTRRWATGSTADAGGRGHATRGGAADPALRLRARRPAPRPARRHPAQRALDPRGREGRLPPRGPRAALPAASPACGRTTTSTR